MTATLNDMAKKKEHRAVGRTAGRGRAGPPGQGAGSVADRPGRALKQLTKTVLETALNEKMTEHLGYGKHDPAGAGTGNIRNGTRGNLP